MQETIEELNSKINELTIENDELKLKLSNQKFEYTISEANNEINRLTNLLNLWIDKKNNIFEETQPKSPNLDSEHVDGSMTREEKFFKYVYKCDKEDVDWWIDRLNEYIVSLNDYVDSELKRIGEYEPLKQKIYNLRNDEEYMKKHKGKPRPFWIIAELVGYSESHVKRIYRKIIKKRNVDEDDTLMIRSI